MPPRKRTEPADDQSEPAPIAPEADDPAIEPDSSEPEQADGPKRGRPPKACPGCFPDGWPAGVTGLGCEHGSWQR